jgi:hypothetical protein
VKPGIWQLLWLRLRRKRLYSCWHCGWRGTVAASLQTGDPALSVVPGEAAPGGRDSSSGPHKPSSAA